MMIMIPYILSFELFQTSNKLLEVLETMNKWIDEIPPIDQPQRFGNKAYRDWFDRLTEVS